MMRTPRTSIIMPVYNTSRTVLSAIASVQAQTDADWELIVVIDASPDDAREKIARYLSDEPDPRVKTISFEVNRGVSAARNAGLEEAVGEWIAFLDSDDAYEPTFLATLHEAAQVANTDVVSCGHKVISADGEENLRKPAELGQQAGLRAAIKMLSGSFTPFLWDKIFRARIAGGLRFSEEIHRAEDALFVLQALMNASLVSVVEEPLYRYSIDTDGLTWGRVTPVEESDKLTRLMAEATSEYRSDPKLREALTVSKVLTYLNNAQQVLVAKSSTSSEALKEIRRRISFGEAATCLKVRPVFGAAAILLKVSPSLYRALYGAYIKRRYGVSMNSN